MAEFVEICWTCGSIDEARKIARYLVQDRLAACVQIIPWIESIYMWNNQLETSQETKVTIKTHQRLIDKVTKVILENAIYQVPEITYKSIEISNPAYKDWMEESTRDFSNIP